MIYLNLSGIQNIHTAIKTKSQLFSPAKSNDSGKDSFSKVSFQGLLFSDGDEDKSTKELIEEAFKKDDEKILLKAMSPVRFDFDPNYKLTKDENDDEIEPTPIFQECLIRNWNKATNELLDDPRTDINARANGTNPLFITIEYDDFINFIGLMNRKDVLKARKVDVKNVKDIDVMAMDKDGNTPFMKAVEKGRIVMAREIDRRCDSKHTLIRNNNNETAWDIAERKGMILSELIDS